MTVATVDTATGANPGLMLGKQDGAKRGRWSRRIVADLIGFVDVAAVVAGGMIPALIYALAGQLPVDWLKHLQMCLVSAIIVYGCLKNYDMYDTGRMHAFPIAPARLAASLAIAFVAVLGLGLPFAPKQMHMWIWYGAWLATSFMMLLGLRIVARAVLARLTRANAFDARVAVYGSGVVSRRVEQHLTNPALGIKFAGRYDDRHDGSRTEQNAAAPVGSLADLTSAARAGDVDQIIIALPQSADQRTVSIARQLEHLPVSLHVVTHMASDLVDSGPAHRVSSLGSVGLLDVKAKPLADWSYVVKLVEDYLLASIMMVVTLPLMALIAIAIKLDSRGPVLFRQRRRGLNHRVFEVLKFRTMHVHGNDDCDVAQATRNDPRVTRVGWLLRRTSLDELPQIINVLRGEMSLVGPRPHALAHDDHFGETVDRYANRQQVKPGITGLAQVSGFRGETETPEKIEKRLALDLDYVNRWSLWLDLSILVRTLACSWTGKNAY